MSKSRPRYSVDEYLAQERLAEERSIYLDGEILPVASESWSHGGITANLCGMVGYQLKGTPCRARTTATKVRTGQAPMAGHASKGMFTYPELLVICGDPEYHDAFRDIVLNPTAIVEVLSPATEAFDRGEKFTRYQTWNPTLTDYLLVSQDQPQIEHFQRQPDGSWSYHRYTGLAASVAIASIHCTLKLADVYDRVVFPAE